MFPPGRIVCLTEETVETLYLLGEQDRIVGISGYVVRPPQARREKPRVSADFVRSPTAVRNQESERAFGGRPSVGSLKAQKPISPFAWHSSLLTLAKLRL